MDRLRKKKVSTYISAFRAAHEERMAYEVMLYDDDDGVPTSLDECYDASDSIHCQLIQCSGTLDSILLKTRSQLFHHEDCDDDGDCVGDHWNWIGLLVCYHSMYYCWQPLIQLNPGDKDQMHLSSDQFHPDPSLAVDRMTEIAPDMIQC